MKCEDSIPIYVGPAHARCVGNQNGVNIMTIEVTITLPEKIGVSRASGNATVSTEKLSPEIVARLVEHGATQKVGDAPSGVKAALGFVDDNEKALKDSDLSAEQLKAVSDKSSAMMWDVIEQLESGIWATKRASAADPLRHLRKYIRAIIRKQVKDSVDYKTADDKSEYIDGLFEKQSDSSADTILKAAQRMWDEENNTDVVIEFPTE